MSQSSNNRNKDAGRKPYNSLNVAFKPVKGETKPTGGQNVRHGLQVLGKVGPRRVPAPTNLPSLRSENSGNDPAISLVPSGQGWVKKDTAVAAGKKGDSPAPVPAKAVQPKVIDTQEISLRPNANVGLGIKAPTLPPPAGGGGTGVADTAVGDAAKLTWGNKVAQKQPASGSSQNFHREFPKLGGAGGGDGRGGGEPGKEGDQRAGNALDANHQATGPPQHSQQGQGMGGGRMQMPMNMQGYPSGQMQYPYPMYPMYAPGPAGRMSMPPYAYPPYYPGPGGKMQPIDPRMMERMAKGQMMPPAAAPSNTTDRPSVVKDSDLRSLDSHKDDGDNGWAGTHEEVDYSAKLQFDESDDSDDDGKKKMPSKSGKDKAKDDHGKQKDKNQPSQENWNEFANHPYNQQMMMAFSHFQRGPYAGYDPQRGPPPGPHGFPYPGMFPHPMFFPQGMPPQSGEPAMDDPRGVKGGADSTKDDNRPSLDKKELDRKARLKKVEESIKKREEDSRNSHGTRDKDEDETSKKVERSRNNSEKSDSSRRSNNVDIPPRFQRQVSSDPHGPHGDAAEFLDNRSGSESPHLTIMKRKDSVKSDDDGAFSKKHDVPAEKTADSSDEKTLTEKITNSDVRGPRHGCTPSLYKETVGARSDRQKRYSSSSDTHEKDRSSTHGSSSSIHKENESNNKKEESSGKHFPKNKELKDLSETRKEKKEERRERKDNEKSKKSHDSKDPEGSQKINSRFAELKLSKGQNNKPAAPVKEHVSSQQPKKDVPTKASPWSNVVSGKPPSKESSDQNKSLRDIQLEEEEKSRAKPSYPVKKSNVPLNTNIEGVPGEDVYAQHEARRNHRGMPPDEPRFRSDAYDDRGPQQQQRNQHQPAAAEGGEDRVENRGYERRGRFNNQRQDQRPMRGRSDQDDYRQNNFNNRTRDGDSRSGSRGGDQRYSRDDNHQGWNSRQRGGGESNNRREDYNERSGSSRNDRNEDQNLDNKDAKEETRGDRDYIENKNKRKEEHRNERKGENNKPEKRDEDKIGDRKEEQKGERRNERRDDSRGDHRRNNEKKDDHRGGERREDHSQDNERGERNERRHKDKKDSRDDGSKKEETDEEWRKVEKKEELKRYDSRREAGREGGRDNRDGGREIRDGRENRRDGPKRDGYRKNEGREEKKDEKKTGYREDNRRKDDQRPRDGRRDGNRPERDSNRPDRDTNRPERDGSGRRHQSAEGEDAPPPRQTYEQRRAEKDKWANRDYRQSEDYQKELKEAQETKEKRRAEEALANEPANKEAVPAIAASTEGEKQTDSAVAPKQEVSPPVQAPVSKPMETETTTKVVETKPEKPVKIEHSMEVKPDISFADKVAPARKEVSELTNGLSNLELHDKEKAKEVIDLTKDSPESATPRQDSKEVTEDAVSEPKNGGVPEDNGKPRQSGGFGVPGNPPKNKRNSERHERSERYDRPERSDSYRGERGDSNYRRGDSSYRGDLNSRGSFRGGRGGERGGRGRGRGSFRGGSAPQLNRERRPSGERYKAGGASREDSRRRKDDLYEPVSDGEFSDSEADEKRTKQHNVDKKNNLRNQKQPPRFQKYDNQQHEGSMRGGRGRGRGLRSERGERSERGGGRGGERGLRGERGRGRGRGRGGSSHPPPAMSPNNFAESKGTDEGESDAYYSAEETANLDEKDDINDEKRISSPTDRDMKSRTRGGFNGRTRGSGRGAARVPRGGSTKNGGSFLVNRQQVGNKRNSSKSEKTPSAADKPDQSEVSKVDGHPKSLDDLSAHSPPKKSKSEKREEPKREIHKEFDLNNIASVVCIDNMKVGVEEEITGAEEEGFVTVTSKKQQKEKRDREREEAKLKLLREQKQEQQAANKAAKQAKNAASQAAKAAAANPVENPAISTKTVQPEAQATTPTTGEQLAITSTASTSVVPTPVAQASNTSNVAMAAFGVWEPAQSLMRTSHGGEMVKTSLAGTMSGGINAWQRPLSISTPTTEVPVPDPRAVGTGKPSAKSNHVPTTESSAPLVSAPVLATIGGHTAETPVIQADERIAVEILPEVVVKKDDLVSESHAHEVKTEVKRDKTARVKLTKTEKAPRFQSKKEHDERSLKGEDRKSRAPRVPSSEKSSKRSTDRTKKGDSKSQSKKIPKELEKQMEDNSPIVFINEIPLMLENQLENSTPRSTLSAADKVVGSNKPSLKTQSSLGSYSSSVDTNIEDPILEVKLQETFIAPLETEVPASVATDTSKGDVDAVISTEERSLETRSLPGTPPLAVKIPEPSPPGPSSDPGRGPSPQNMEKAILPNATQEMNKEMNEMNRRLLNARRAWDDTPTTWSDTPVVVSSTATSEVAPSVPPIDTPATTTSIEDPSTIPGSPSKSEPSAPVSIETHQKSNEEKVSVSGVVFPNKRTEQQVCKVKPQQQLPTEEIKPYQATTRPTARQVARPNTANQQQKYASYGLPIDRSLQPAAASSTLYTSDSVYNTEQHRSQQQQQQQQQQAQQTNPALNFQSLAPGRSISTSVSPHSQQRDMVLSSLQVGNMYSANTLQVSQSQFLAWQVTQSVQPTKTMPYQTYTQGSSFTSPVSIAANSPVIMQYGTSFPPQQRSTSDMQRQHVNLMPMQQHQPPGQQGGRLVGMMPSRGAGSHVPRRNQGGYPQQMSASDGHMVNPNQMPLMMEPNTANMNHPQQMSRQMANQHLANHQQMANQQMAAGQQMTGQQRSDLMKHVHAKPFEPTSQTPPLMQSPPVVAQSSSQIPLQLHQQQGQQQSPQQQAQQLAPSVFNTHQDHHMQNMHNNFSQTAAAMMQQRQHNVQHGVQHMPHQPPLVASVRPRSIQEQQSLSNGSASHPMGNQDRLNNISPFNTPFMTNNMNYKGRNSRGVNLQVAVPQTALTNQFAQHALQQQQQQQTGHSTSRSPAVPLNLVSGLGPIQRPPQVHQQPTIPHDKSFVLNRGVVGGGGGAAAQDGEFKQTQRQKMLEDTKKYFEQKKQEQEQKAVIPTPSQQPTEKPSVVAEEKPVSSVAPTLAKQMDLSKHNKIVLPNNPPAKQDGSGAKKNFDYKKNLRNNEKSRTTPPVAPPPVAPLATAPGKRIQPPIAAVEVKAALVPEPATTATTAAKKAGD